MGRGSQLSQLKSALSSAGLSRSSQPGGSNASSKKRKRAAAAGRDPALEKAAKAKKLGEIQSRMNPFDTKVTRLKHDVGGRKVKGVVGRPGVSKQEGLEKRKKLLLPEYEKKNKVGGIIDRRFGESDLTLTPEERMLERFTRERQRTSRGVDFNLDDEVEDELTHYGQSLSAVDDFDGAGLGLDDDDEEANPPMAVDAVEKARADDDGEVDPDEPQRKKTKAEVMSEVIAKSKEYKHLRQLAKEQDDDIRHAMDSEFGSIRDLLFGPKTDPSSSGSNAIPLGTRSTPGQPSPIQDSGPAPAPSISSASEPAFALPQTTVQNDDEDYDQVVRALVFDKRAKPTDRTKTEEEIAAEEAEKLQKQEKARLRRMRGDPEESDEDGDERPRKRRRGVPQGDDLDDDFELSGDESDHGLGPGLEEAIELGSSGDEWESEGRDEDEDDDGDEDEDEDDEEEPLAPLPMVKTKDKGKGKATTRKKGDIPFTFPAPSSHEEFLDIIDGFDPSDIPTVIQRIRTIHHASLAEDNKFKLQKLCEVLIDHVVHLASPPQASLANAEALSEHIYSLSTTYPAVSATAFNSKIELMQKNLARGLDKGPLLESSKTWPGTAELALLRMVGNVWSTSDKKHAVVNSAGMLMAQYLGQGRIRGLADIASGVFLCHLVHFYYNLPKRFMPEATNFLFQALILLAPHSLTRSEIPFPFASLDFEKHATLSIERKCQLTPKPAQLSAIINWDQTSDPRPEQHKVDLLAATYELIGLYADMWKELDGFIELFEPFVKLMDLVRVKKLSKELVKLHETRVEALTRMLKFAKSERKPLTTQSHKPIPIATYAPRFDERYSYRKRSDPDSARNEASKLKAEYKKEHKGAMRELRKDARFLAEEQTRRQLETEAGYKKRMAQVHGSIQVERAEEKAMDRMKQKEKRRAGK
ncbi:Nop14-like protein [Clavulina sp. PMI_390]|nr:Nop14-like protein [Clavulina sp. PMI_390]